MKNKMKDIVLKISEVAASSALLVTKSNVNSACTFLSYQDKLPEGAEKLSKIK